MSSARIVQLVLVLLLVLLALVARGILVALDCRRLGAMGKNSYTAAVALSANSAAVPFLAIGLGLRLLPALLTGWGLEKYSIPVDSYVQAYAWVPRLLGWLCILPSVLLIAYNLSRRVSVQNGEATFTKWFVVKQSVKLADITAVKERFRRHRAGVLPVYQCVYDVYTKAEGGEKKLYTLSNTIGGIQFLRDCADLKKIQWKDTTPKRYARNPLIFPDLQQQPVGKGATHQELYLLAIPNLLTRQMINNNLPEAAPGAGAAG